MNVQNAIDETSDCMREGGFFFIEMFIQQVGDHNG